MFIRLLRTATLAFVVAFVQSAFTPAFACSCDTTAPPCRAMWQSDLVFSGRVETIEYVDAPPPEYSHYRVTFLIDSVLRGERASELTIKTASTGATCGYEFHEGDSYVVYGYAQNGAVWTNRCGRTRPLNEAAEDLDYAAGLTPEASCLAQP